MKQSEEWRESLIPEDIALAIASFLQVSELCALGTCSRFWREVCASDFIWVSLARDRWPSLNISERSAIPLMIKSRENSEEVLEQEFSSGKGWRSFYIKRHNDMAGRATDLVRFVEECATSSESLEVGEFQKAIEKLCLMEMGFKDIVMLLFTSRQNVLLNLVGLHYCLFWLGVPADIVFGALWNCHVSERQVCVKWWKLGRWFYGFRMRDESICRRVSLGDLALAREKEVLGVLYRGAIHEVFRVQISVPDLGSSTWASQTMHTHN